MKAVAVAAPGGLGRWCTYQRERFPVVSHGVLISAFSFSAVCYSMLLRGADGLPGVKTMAVAFASSFLFFLQLRICDEFKDADEDARFRPYRPVPRGLVTLRELGYLGGLAASLQLVLALWLHPALVWLLLVCWGYLALMSREFFAASWLRARPTHYLWSHMLIMPVIDLYVTACDWLPAGGPPTGLVWLLAISFTNGVVIEVGRKLRAPADEEAGVETYSVLWGRPRAVAVWLTAMLATSVFAVLASRAIQFTWPVTLLVLVLLAVAGVCAKQFLSSALMGAGKRIEVMSGVWTLLVYWSVGLVPLLWQRLWRVLA